MEWQRSRSAGLALCGALFVLLAIWATSGGSQAFDLAVRQSVNGWASPTLTHVMQAVTTLGAGIVLWPVGAVVVWWLAAAGRRRQAIWFAAVVLGADLASQLLKLVFHRARPAVFFGLSPAESYSFPSGHAFVTTVFLGALAGVLADRVHSRTKRGWLAAAIVVVAFWVGLSRVYLGYHYPSDVLGGWTLAAIWLMTAGRWQERNPHR